MPSCQSEKLCDVTQTSEQPEGLEKDVRRQAYLVTYSRADTEEFNKRGLVDAVVNAFKSVTKSSNKYCSCCQERHKGGGAHFHMALLLNKATRWLRVQEYLDNFLGIAVNFSGHGGYYTAYNFVLKEDLNVEFSMGHPKKVMKPRMYVASKTKSRQRKVKIANFQKAR